MMAWVSITADHDYRFNQTITEYKAGWTGNVTQACADEIVSLGKGVKVKTPRKGEVHEPEPVGTPNGKDQNGR